MRGSTRRRRPANKVKTESFALKGGLNLVDAPLSLPPGMCLAISNFEALTKEGYRRIDGHERYDGQAKPSDASYWILDFDAGDIAEPAEDSICTGLTSGATGKVGLVVLESGSWVSSNAAGHLVLFNVVGSFQNNEELGLTGSGDEFNYEFSSEFS